MAPQSQYEWPSRKKAHGKSPSQVQPASTKQTAKPPDDSGEVSYDPINRQPVRNRLPETTQKKPDLPVAKPKVFVHDDSDDDGSSHQESTGSLPKIKCTYANCQKRFDTIKEMKRHKTNAPEHDYCKKCDVDCEDWDALVQHKVDAMAPFLDRRQEPGATPKHIVCEFCGQNFESFGGRKLHREHNHKAQQDIRCTLCHALFSKVAFMVAHLESGKCPSISGSEFMARIQQQRARAQIMKAPGVFNENLALNAKSLMIESLSLELRKLITDGSETLDTEVGGISLIDNDNAEQMANMGKVLVPDIDLMGMDPQKKTPASMDPATEYYKAKKKGDDFGPVPLTQANLRERTEQWPTLPKKQLLTAMSISMSDVTSRRGGNKIDSDVDQWSISQSPAPSTVDDFDNRSESTVVGAEQEGEPQNPWADKAATETLRQDDKPSGKEGWKLILKQRDHALAAHKKGNNEDSMLKWQGWNPNTPEYNPAVFYRFDGVTLSGKYCCPFPDCTLSQYEDPDDIEQHIRLAHLDTQFRCSACQKEFKKPSALMGHIEDTINCKIKESNLFKHVSRLPDRSFPVIETLTVGS